MSFHAMNFVSCVFLHFLCHFFFLVSVGCRMCLGSFISEARAAWKLLNGVICVHKPLGMVHFRFQEEIRLKLAEGLNNMKVREPETFVEIKRIENSGNTSTMKRINPLELTSDESLDSPRGPPTSNLALPSELVSQFADGPDMIEIVKRTNYADHVLVVGPRYQTQDIKLFDISRLGVNTSGLTVMGINGGTRTASNLRHLRWVRTYLLSGRFGTATSTGFHTGRIIDKATFHKIQKESIERYLSATQAAHQKNMFAASGVPLTSDRAYEIASQGLPRPDSSSSPLVYSLKCKNFKLPDFEIEVAVINENEDFLIGLIHDCGIRLRSAATCTKIRCLKYGPFTSDLGLLLKHVNPANIINNTLRTAEILKTVDLWVRDPLILPQSSDSLAPRIQKSTKFEMDKEMDV